MNRTIRGMAGLLVAFGVSACASDYSLQFETPPTKIQASPTVMFITSGDAPKELLLRLTNDINQSVPASFTVSNVPSGLTVEHDDNYRPDFVNSTGTLQQPDQLVQQRYFVSANVPTGGMFTFTVSSGSFSQDITVRVLPIDLGAALSATAPAIGDPVTITAPANLSFSTTAGKESTVNIPGGGDAVITDLSAKSITFLPIPGSSGVATVTNVILDYAPTLSPMTLKTTSSIDVAAVTSIPLAYNKTSISAPEILTVSATGFVFESNVKFTFDGEDAWVASVASDGSSAQIVVQGGLSGATATVSNVHLSFLSSVSLSDIPSSVGLTTGAYPTRANTESPGGSSPQLNIPAVGTPSFIADHPTYAGGDLISAGGPNSWYHVTVTGTGQRHFAARWFNGADVDFFMTDDAINNFINYSAGSSNPEAFDADVDDGTSYWFIAALYAGASADLVMGVN